MNSCLALHDMFLRLQGRRSVLIFRILQVQRSLREQDRSRHMIAVNLIMTVDIPITAVTTKAETPAEIMMTEA